MKIYKVENPFAEQYYSIFGCIVCANNEDEARRFIPDKNYELIDNQYYFRLPGKPLEQRNGNPDWWCHFKKVKITYLGKANKDIKKGIILIDNRME